VFQNFAFQFRNAVSVSEYRVPISECRFCFGSALSALCHHILRPWPTNLTRIFWRRTCIPKMNFLPSTTDKDRQTQTAATENITTSHSQVVRMERPLFCVG